MRPRTLSLLVVALLAGGCATDVRDPGRGTPLPRASATGAEHTAIVPPHPRYVEPAPEMSEELRDRVTKGQLRPVDARRIELERSRQRTAEVERALDQIKKEAREEYARSRPETIQTSILKENVCLGMTDRDVLVCWGEPRHKTRMVTQRGTRETWIYKETSVWFEQGLVAGWQTH